MKTRSLVFINKTKDLGCLNEQLTGYHYAFSKKELSLLKEWQTSACQKYQMFDFSSEIIKLIILKLSMSPYLNQASFLMACKDFIYLFYACRKNEVKLIYDDELVERLYQLYLQNNGVIDKTLMQKAIKSVKRNNND